MHDITITKVNEVYIRVHAELGIIKELAEFLKVYAKNYRWHPLVKSGQWNGKINLLNLQTRMCYGGLAPYIQKWAAERDYTFSDETEEYGNELSLIEAEEFVKSLNLPKELGGQVFEVRDYQMKYFINSIRYKKSIELSPTASGKSLIIYLILRWCLANEKDFKGFLIVPTIALTAQLISDFEEYGWEDARDYCHQVYAGIEKGTEKPITISTWQSLFTRPAKWFKQYTFAMGDEVQEYDAKAAKHILESSTNARYRIGMTGTLSDAKCSQFTLEGLFGPTHQAVTTKELIDRGLLAQFKIKALILKHLDTICKSMQKAKYEEEIEYLIGSEARNRYITNLAVSLKGNTLILFRYVEKHGEILTAMIKKALQDTNRNVYYIDGSIKMGDREIIRKILEKETDAILVASTQTFSRGSNIRNLHNLVIAFPNKAKIRLLQSIGRVLRLVPGKVATLYDIADDLRYLKHENTTMKHFKERLKVYAKEGFNYKFYKVQLKG